MQGLAGQIERWGRSLSRGWRTIRTGFGFAALGIASLLLAICAAPLVALVLRSREQRELRVQRLIHHACRGYLRGLELLGLARIRCTGAERLREPGTLVVANHPTLLDALVLMSLMPQADCVVKERYYDHPFLGATLAHDLS